MGILVNLSDVVNRSTGGNNGTPEMVNFFKSARVGAAAAAATIAGQMTDMWQYAGHNGPGAAPGGVVRNPNNTTPGSLKQANGGGSRQKWRLSLSAALGLGTRGTLILYDRLLDISGLSGTVVTPQAVGGSLTRYTNGEGNVLMASMYNQVGASAAVITASYTNTVPTAGRTTEGVAFGATGRREAQRAILLPLQSGDTGVTACASVTVSVTTGTAGDFGVAIIHPIAYIPLSLNGDCRLITNVEEIPDDACLAWLWVPSTTVAPEIYGTMFSIES